MTRNLHHSADPEQSTAIIDFLRHRDTRPFAADPNEPLPDAVAALWARTFGRATQSPAWEPLALAEPFERPVTVLSAQIPECPDLTLLAATLPIVGSCRMLAVFFAALRPCAAGTGHRNVVALQSERDLAQAVFSSAVDGRVDHATCRPSHGDAAAGWRLNRADEMRDADPDADRLALQRH